MRDPIPYLPPDFESLLKLAEVFMRNCVKRAEAAWKNGDIEACRALLAQLAANAEQTSVMSRSIIADLVVLERYAPPATSKSG